jgi:hypothetical protein
MDDNNDIIAAANVWYPFVDAIMGRLAIGLETYGHGVRVNDDTTQWGTKTDSWLEMGLEEIDDLAIYVIAETIRYGRKLTPASEDKSAERVLAGIRFQDYIQVIQDLSEVRTKIMNLMDDA